MRLHPITVPGKPAGLQYMHEVITQWRCQSRWATEWEPGQCERRMWPNTQVARLATERRSLLSLIPRNSGRRRVKLQKYRENRNENSKEFILDDVSSNRQETKSMWSTRSVAGKTGTRFSHQVLWNGAVSESGRTKEMSKTVGLTEAGSHKLDTEKVNTIMWFLKKSKDSNPE